MSVDYYSCANCSQTFPDCGDYFGCDCGEVFCSDECGGAKRFELEGSDASSCKICRGDIVTDEQLLEYLIKQSGQARAAHVKAIMKSRKDDRQA